MTPAEADAVLAKNTIRKINPAKATVTYHDASLPGKPQVVVSTTNGSIVTVIKNKIKEIFGYER
ncbi:MAG: hypothetical protein JO315_16225 [Acidobacteria bacterium]|nr:hypothetical protein [Acidobacteriota bacterium]